MSQPTTQAPPADAPRSAERSDDGPADRTTSPVQRLLRVQAFQIVLVLAVIFLIFTALAPDTFPGWGNIRQAGVCSTAS